MLMYKIPLLIYTLYDTMNRGVLHIHVLLQCTVTFLPYSYPFLHSPHPLNLKRFIRAASNRADSSPAPQNHNFLTKSAWNRTFLNGCRDSGVPLTCSMFEDIRNAQHQHHGNLKPQKSTRALERRIYLRREDSGKPVYRIPLPLSEVMCL